MTEVMAPPATADGDDEARQRQIVLRGQYRTLQDMEARQRAIIAELAQIDQLADPQPDDLAWQGTIITEHDDLDVLADPLRARAKALERVRAAHADPANREGPERTPDLATNNVISADPFRELDRVRHGLVDRQELRGRALDAIELYSKRGDMRQEFAENATEMAQEQFFGRSNVAAHILETGSTDYYDMFRNYVSDPARYAARAALTLTSANGGFVKVAAAAA